MKKTLFKLAFAVMALMPAAVWAQSSSINAFSPYTMYGIGELSTQGSLPMRSMGGVGVGLRNLGMVNMLNPAAYSAVPRKSFLFNFGLEGENFYNYQNLDQQQKKSMYNTFNFHDIALQFPLGKNVGFGFSIAPYSSVGYRVKSHPEFDPNDPVQGNIGMTQSLFEGEGDVTEVKFGVGWEIFKNFSLGVAAQYYWGDITRTFTTSFGSVLGDGSYYSVKGEDNYGISSFKGQVGVQWSPLINKKRVLTIGATYDIGGDINPDRSSKVYNGDLMGTVVKGDTTTLDLVLPRQVTVGLFYQTAKWALGVDYTYQNWKGRNSNAVNEVKTMNGLYNVAYANTSTIKIGAEFTPGRFDVRHYMKRVSYRAGFRYGDYNQTFGGKKLSEMAVTVGMGFPIKFLGSSAVDVGFEYGRRGYNVSKSLGLMRQQYFKFSLGFSLFAGGENGEYWFMRPKYD